MLKKNIHILAIESSCDDTGSAIIINGKVKINITANQVVHIDYGGVVPELASRQHLTHIIPTLDAAIKKSNVDINTIDAIAFTNGPGLLGSLLVGVSVAKALALSLDIPLIEVHHMHAHVLAHFASDYQPCFPFLCLTVSGGHTQIVLVKDYTEMEIIGTTLDDAAGEAFDKTGKMLGLPYPAGPEIDKLASLGSLKFSFPEPKVEGLNFSFSGLKTSILYFLQKEISQNKNFIQENIHDICYSVQSKIVDILLHKLSLASKLTGIRQVGIAGGVSANSELRKRFTALGIDKSWTTFIPPYELCADNAGMIGVAGYYKYLKGQFSDQSVQPLARMPF